MISKIFFSSIVMMSFFGCGGETPSVSDTKKKIFKEKNPYGVQLKNPEKVAALTNFIIREKVGIEKLNFPKKPKEPIFPESNKLVKGTYEKSELFTFRVQKAQEEREYKINKIQIDYNQAMSKYNAEVLKLKNALNKQIGDKKQEITLITPSAIQEAYQIVYGTPYLTSDLKYDADNERFYARIKSTKDNFSQKVIIKVPVAEAELFEKNRELVKTKVVFDYISSKLILKKIIIEHAKKEYIALPTANEFQSKHISVNINNGNVKLDTSSNPALSLESEYVLGALDYSNDPEIAKLQKQKFALEKEAFEQKQTFARDRKLNTKKESLEAQIALLQKQQVGVNDIPKYLEKSSQVKVDRTKWLFVIGIEEYAYTDSVIYSANSASSFKKVMKKRLGIPEKNIRTLINKNATAAKIDFKLKDMLRRVKKGDTVYFYYSGHGIPVPAKKNQPFMLAQDMNPAYMSDERFNLENIYRFLSQSKATKVIAFVDSCFSGGTDNQALIKGVAATRLKPKKVTFDKDKMLVLSAGSGIQYSNKYDAKSNRLFSYYVMRGLIKENQDTEKLFEYIKSNVQEKSYEMGSSYEQVPVFDGDVGLGL